MYWVLSVDKYKNKQNSGMWDYVNAQFQPKYINVYRNNLKKKNAKNIHLSLSSSGRVDFLLFLVTWWFLS